MRGWPLVFSPSTISTPSWMTDDGFKTLLACVKDNSGWGLEELNGLYNHYSNLSPFIHVISMSDRDIVNDSLVLNVSGDQFTVPVIRNSLALSETVNCFAVPSKMGSNVYIVNALMSEEYLDGVSTSSGYLYLLPTAERIYYSDGTTPFEYTDGESLLSEASGLYVRYLPTDFYKKTVEVYVSGWVEAVPKCRYLYESEDIILANIQTRVPLVSEKELATAIQLKRCGLNTPEWGIASELYLGRQFWSNNVPSGLLEVSHEAQYRQYTLDENENVVSNLLWTPTYTGEYVSSISVNLPPNRQIKMVGYTGVKIENNAEQIIAPMLWGNSDYSDSIMDILED